MPDRPNQLTMADFKLGQRIQLAPHTDLWMRGMRYGMIIRIPIVGKRSPIYILGDNGRTYGIHPDMIGEIVTSQLSRLTGADRPEPELGES